MIFIISIIFWVTFFIRTFLGIRLPIALFPTLFNTLRNEITNVYVRYLLVRRTKHTIEHEFQLRHEISIYLNYFIEINILMLILRNLLLCEFTTFWLNYWFIANIFSYLIVWFIFYNNYVVFVVLNRTMSIRCNVFGNINNFFILFVIRWLVNNFIKVIYV